MRVEGKAVESVAARKPTTSKLVGKAARAITIDVAETSLDQELIAKMATVAIAVNLGSGEVSAVITGLVIITASVATAGSRMDRGHVGVASATVGVGSTVVLAALGRGITWQVGIALGVGTLTVGGMMKLGVAADLDGTVIAMNVITMIARLRPVAAGDLTATHLATAKTGSVTQNDLVMIAGKIALVAMVAETGTMNLATKR